MEKTELIALLAADGSIGTLLTADEHAEACDDASADTGWSFPVSDKFEVKWIKQRTKRHCYFKLQTQSARKFKIEQINLNQRFEHYRKLVADMDAEFKAVVDDYPEKFSAVDPYKMFGTVTGPGFVYDDLGRDRTYK